MKTRVRHRTERNLLASQGVSAIEFAIVIPVLLLLVFGITEGGRAIYQYNTLAKATRDAARYLSFGVPGSGFAAARCLAVNGNTDCTGDPLVPGLKAINVDIKDASNDAGHANVQSTGNPPGNSTGVMNLVTVTIRDYHFQWLGPYALWDVTFGPIHTTMRQVT
jgi:Flp pilus assembly protein TadG